MNEFQKSVQNRANTVSGLELKQLLILLSGKNNICFRFRQVGGMWMKHHMRVDSVNQKSVLLRDEKDNRFYLVSINSIMQFDIDEKFQAYLPNFHYSVQPSPELDYNEK